VALLLDDRAKEWRDRAREFAEEVIAPAAQREWEPDADARMPWDVIEEGSRRGFRTMAVPPEYGGPDPAINGTTFAMILAEMATADPGIAIFFNHAIKDVRQIARNGTDAQKETFFTRFMADDRFLTANALTEPAHGGDRYLPPPDFRFETTAVRDGDGWRINGLKHCIATGNHAGVVLVQACTNPEKPYRESTSTFIVYRDNPGLLPGEIHDKLGLRMQTNSQVVLKDCWVSDDDVLGRIDQAVPQRKGQFNDNGLFSIAMKLGIARAAYRTALDHARNRVQGGKPIIEHQAVGLKLAEMAAQMHIIESMMFRYAMMVDQPEEMDPMFGEVATWATVEAAFRAATLGVQICGCSGSWLDHPAQKHLRDASMYFPNDGTHTIHLLAAQRMMMAGDVSGDTSPELL